MEAVINKIQSAASVAVLTHISEDPDALGSAFAFCAVLRKLGKEACCYVSEKPQERFKFISEDYVIYNPDEKVQCDLCLCLDCGDIERLGERVKIFNEAPNTASIDHHMTNNRYAQANYVEADASSTGEILVKVFEKMGVQLDDNIARLLYIAICSDTGCFKYSNVKPETFITAAKLIGYNFDAAEAARLLFDTEDMPSMKFKAELMSCIESYADGKVSVVEIKDEMYEKCAITASEAPQGVDIPRMVAGTEIAVCFKNKNGGVHMSLRSNGKADVAAIAEKFGGGGHRAAAGCVVKDGRQMAQVKAEVIEECKKAVESL